MIQSPRDSIHYDYRLTSNETRTHSNHYNVEVASYKNHFCKINHNNLPFDGCISTHSNDFPLPKTHICQAKIDHVDRFIPNRKFLNKNYLAAQQQESQSNDKMEDSRNLVPELYRRYVMNQNWGRVCKSDTTIESYENSNLLKYSTQQVNAEDNQKEKSFGLELNDELARFQSCRRKISKCPTKVLDAPALQDDYYLNLIDWSSQNYLAVGLATSVYIWNASNSKVIKLCDLGIRELSTSVACSPKGPVIALGTNSGEVQIWDANKIAKIRTLPGHSLRVGAMAWSSGLLSTGSRDKTVLQRDLRCESAYVMRLVGHRQQICGLKWSPDEQQLCSGGNDNKLLVWGNHNCQPLLRFTDHLAAVKAVAWSPHQHGLLVSGGGTADRSIKFRNTLTGVTLNSFNVGSQVCNLMFSRSLNELVSTHGYSQNEINLWRCPQMQKVATLTGHSFRVLYLAMSPDGSTIVTGAGDETLRFWNIFPGKSETSKDESVLSNHSVMLR